MGLGYEFISFSSYFFIARFGVSADIPLKSGRGGLFLFNYGPVLSHPSAAALDPLSCLLRCWSMPLLSLRAVFLLSFLFLKRKSEKMILFDDSVAFCLLQQQTIYFLSFFKLIVFDGSLKTAKISAMPSKKVIAMNQHLFSVFAEIMPSIYTFDSTIV